MQNSFRAGDARPRGAPAAGLQGGSAAGPSNGSTAGSSDLYRAVWRWHFYAGLLVLPFLVLLSVTGGIYLFRQQLDPIIHADLMRVEPRGGAPLPAEEQVRAALAAHPGTAFRYLPPPAPGRTAEIGVRGADGVRTVVYVDPGNAAVLGSLGDKGTAMGFVRRLHSLAVAGPVGRGLMEIAGGWCVLLVGTGLYLWWPRGARRGEKGGVVSVRGTPKRRVFWRDLHAVTGLMVGSALVFLAVTGMPWSVFSGSYVNQWANGGNFGYPSGVRVAVPMSEAHLAQAAPTSWSLEQARLPLSSMPSGAPSGASFGSGPALRPVGLDAALARFDGLGLAPGYAVSLPNGAGGVYTGSVYPNDLSRQRVVHLDQYSGTTLLDMGYADHGPLGRALEWGINVHMGQQWGLANQLVLVAVCLGTVLLCVAAGVAWWKRRPAGRLGVPPLPADRRVLGGVAAILLAGGLLMPLVGLSLLVILGLDLLLTRSRRGSRAAA